MFGELYREHVSDSQLIHVPNQVALSVPSTALYTSPPANMLPSSTSTLKAATTTSAKYSRKYLFSPLAAPNMSLDIERRLCEA